MLCATELFCSFTEFSFTELAVVSQIFTQFAVMLNDTDHELGFSKRH